jgi:hypothetical protein
LSLSEISKEFQNLAAQFENALPEYAGNCYLGAAKCEKLIGNDTEIDLLLKGGRMFVKANDKRIAGLGCVNSNHEHLDGARRCYNQALASLPEGAAIMKTAIIRELKKIDPNTEQTSSFSSNAHRIFDLEAAANIDIHFADYVTALEKLTEIFDIITERKSQCMYEDVILRTTVSRLLLLLILELPASRCHSPSYIKLMERYSSIEFSADDSIPGSLFILLQGLTMACLEKDPTAVQHSFDELSYCNYLNEEQKSLLMVLYQKNCDLIFQNC